RDLAPLHARTRRCTSTPPSSCLALSSCTSIFCGAAHDQSASRRGRCPISISAARPGRPGTQRLRSRSLPGRPRRPRDPDHAHPPLRRAVLACARAADCVIATDRVLEPAVMTHLAVERSRIRVIPNALDVPAIDRLASAADATRVRREAGARSNELVVLSVGRLEHNKGFHVLAAALGALRDHAPTIAAGNWSWVIV